jgi:hypothetical protein
MLGAHPIGDSSNVLTLLKGDDVPLIAYVSGDLVLWNIREICGIKPQLVDSVTEWP